MRLFVLFETAGLVLSAIKEIAAVHLGRIEVSRSDLVDPGVAPTDLEIFFARRASSVVSALLRGLPISSTCLQRSVALKRVLEKRGLRPTLCIGAGEADGALAHAWLELGGVVVLGPALPYDRRFVSSVAADG